MDEVLYDPGSATGFGWGVRVGDYDPNWPGDEIFHIFEGVLDCGRGRVLRVVELGYPWFCDEKLVYEN
jgi:hypothetical protein